MTTIKIEKERVREGSKDEQGAGVQTAIAVEKCACHRHCRSCGEKGKS